jgi:hypothetical protein
MGVPGGYRSNITRDANPSSGVLPTGPIPAAHSVDPFAGQIAYSDPYTHPGGSKGDYLQTVNNAGTTYAIGSKDEADFRRNNYESVDPRNYMYGRSPGAADAAVAAAAQTGQQGQQIGAQAAGAGDLAAQTGAGLLGQRTGDAQYFNNRTTGNPQALQLAGLEATQGPSAAGAQLQQGTNIGLANQLALARSGRGFGGNAAAMGQAQTNMAGIQANQANSAAQLAAQENAAWRQRQASNLANSAGIQLSSQGQNDVMAGNMLGLGQQAYFQGAGVQQQGYGQALQGVNTNLSGQGLGNNIRGAELSAGQNHEDAMLRAWAAQNNLNLAQQQRSDNQTAGYVSAAAAAAPMLLAAL